MPEQPPEPTLIACHNPAPRCCAPPHVFMCLPAHVCLCDAQSGASYTSDWYVVHDSPAALFGPHCSVLFVMAQFACTVLTRAPPTH